MTKTISDLTFSIKKCAFLVAQILEDYDPDFLPFKSEFGYYGAEFQTRPLYNSRETGLVFSMELKHKVINVYVYEHRVVDDICVTIWEDSSFKDCYTESNIKDGDKRYEEGTYIDKSFDYNQYHQCADFVYKTFENFYNETCGKKEKNVSNGKMLLNAQYNHEKQCQADDEDRHLGTLDAEEVHNEKLNDFRETFDI